MKIIVDQELCMGCRHCAFLCPDVFEIGEGGKSHVISQDFNSCDIDIAISECPVDAILKEE